MPTQLIGPRCRCFWLVRYCAPQLWRLVELVRPAQISKAFSFQYDQELGVIENFVEGLPRIQRALAAVPTYMIFDDHDVTDDWNLTWGWEESAYGHPFSQRIIGNALIDYLLCQGWGNAPQCFPNTLTNSLRQFFRHPNDVMQDGQIDRLLDFEPGSSVFRHSRSLGCSTHAPSAGGPSVTFPIPRG